MPVFVCVTFVYVSSTIRGYYRPQTEPLRCNGTSSRACAPSPRFVGARQPSAAAGGASFGLSPLPAGSASNVNRFSKKELAPPSSLNRTTSLCQPTEENGQLYLTTAASPSSPIWEEADVAGHAAAGGAAARQVCGSTHRCPLAPPSRQGAGPDFMQRLPRAAKSSSSSATSRSTRCRKGFDVTLRIRRPGGLSRPDRPQDRARRNASCARAPFLSEGAGRAQASQ